MGGRGDERVLRMRGARRTGDPEEATSKVIAGGLQASEADRERRDEDAIGWRELNWRGETIWVEAAPAKEALGCGEFDCDDRLTSLLGATKPDGVNS